MRTLYDFLLMEAKSGKEFGPGWQDISNRGKLSNQAKIIMGVANLKSAKLAVDSKEGRENIKEKFGNIPGNSKKPLDFLITFFEKKTDMSEYLSKPQVKEEDKSIKIELRGDWASVGGQKNTESSLKVIRFWIDSLLRVYCGQEGEDLKIGYAVNKDAAQLIVYIKE